MEPGREPSPRWLLAAVAALALVVIVVGWGPHMQWGLWLDETFVAWQAEAGWAIARDKLGDPAQSVLFGYLEALFYFPGSPHMEAWLRFPALLGGVVSCLLAYPLAERLVGKGTGLVAFVAMVASRQMMINGTQARPYTWAVAACLASLWGFLLWLETGRRRHGFLFSVSLALVVHLHMLFAAFVVVPAFVLYRRARRGQPIDWRGLFGWLGLTVLLVLPPVLLLLRLSAVSDPSAFGLPSLGSALEVLIPGTILLSLVPFALLLIPAGRNAAAALRAAIDRDALRLGAFWLLVPPLLLLAASYLLRRTLFIERYFLYTIAAQGLIVAMLFRGFPQVARTLLLCACFFTTPIIHGVHIWSQKEDLVSWRPALQTIRTLDPAGAVPVFVQSGHPPSNAVDWQHGLEKGMFFWSQLTAYPLPNHVYPLPYDADESVRAYLDRLLDTELARTPVIFVTGLLRHPTMRWVVRFFEARGYTVDYAVREGFWVLTMHRPPAGDSGR